MENSKLSLSIMPNRLAVCRLEKDARIPSWATDDTFFSISKTNDELSIVCSESKVPDDIKSEKNWRAFKGVSIFFDPNFATFYNFYKEVAKLRMMPIRYTQSVECLQIGGRLENFIKNNHFLIYNG